MRRNLAWLALTLALAATMTVAWASADETAGDSCCCCCETSCPKG